MVEHEVQNSKTGLRLNFAFSLQLVCLILLAAPYLLPDVATALSSETNFCFEEVGKEYGINPVLLKSIAQIESNLNPEAINKNQNGSIDIGLMQINSFWVKTLRLDPSKLISDPCYNTTIGAKVLKQCIDRYGYTWEAVGCYNATSTAKKIKYSWKIYKALSIEHQASTGGRKMYDSQHTAVNTQTSLLYFKVRDKATNHEIEMEGQ
ncbi:hypothetical protein JZK55_20380 [Dissulfurispira thermophila]|uniref:Transglycosylase SLT domain-containing protein n=2 Tax=root TaxID=1 RepID=A0A7G1H5C0_9BACT|nr:lytic transglycosylase domain-containing protein [Dissulfurispira thermophila]BCB97116.1 hypothetical protein JZK55_20380 [Dissulfurispira thermophila]